MVDENSVLYSDNGEDSWEEELIDLIANNEDIEVGSEIYMCDVKKGTLSKLFYINNLFDDLECNVFDACGEWAEDIISDIPQEKRNELNDLICKWLDENIGFEYFDVYNVRPYIITKEDMDDYWGLVNVIDL